MNKKYYKEIDICKGVLAIFVIVGHVFLQTEVENIKLQAILNIIGGDL